MLRGHRDPFCFLPSILRLHRPWHLIGLGHLPVRRREHCCRLGTGFGCKLLAEGTAVMALGPDIDP